MESLWTLPELVAEVATRIAALPASRNGQVRAIPDDRTVRYYSTIGLLDRPSVMRGRTALYGLKHVAQIVAIKRLQTMGRSLSEIQTLWPTLDAVTLARMSGVELEATPQPSARAAFWKHAPRSQGALDASIAGGVGGWVRGRSAEDIAGAPAAVELRVELAPNVILSLSVVDETVAISPADVRAIRAAAAPLVAELASRRLTPHLPGEEP